MPYGFCSHFNKFIGLGCNFTGTSMIDTISFRIKLNDLRKCLKRMYFLLRSEYKNYFWKIEFHFDAYKRFWEAIQYSKKLLYVKLQPQRITFAWAWLLNSCKPDVFFTFIGFSPKNMSSYLHSNQFTPLYLFVQKTLKFGLINVYKHLAWSILHLQNLWNRVKLNR